MSMTIQEYANRRVGQQSLLQARIDEFRALTQVGADTSHCREDAHTLLDSMLDGFAEFTQAAMRGDFS